MDIGYVRISAKTQNLSRQLDLMTSLGIEKRFVFQDIASGKNFERPRLPNHERDSTRGRLSLH